MESRYTWRNQVLTGLRNFAVVGGVVVLLTYLVVVSGQAAREEMGRMFVEEKSEITVIDEPVVYGYEDGAKIWEVRSELAEEEKETESTELTRIYELILFKGGEENVLIRGDRGYWDKPREKLTLIGNVEVESADGTTLLDTEKLIWEEKTKTLECPEFVDFWVEDNHVIANSLYSDDDLATIDFVGDVEMFVVGLEGASFITREGDFPIEDIEGEPTGEGMNVLAEYVHYDKGDRTCLCYPYIPQRIRNEHNLDEEGRQLPEKPSWRPFDLASLLNDPEYVEALRHSVAELDLTEAERAFLAGETDTLETGVGGDEPASSGIGARGTFGPDGFIPGGMPFGPDVGMEPGAEEVLGPDIPEPVAGRPPEPIDLPGLPMSDPEVVLSSPDYLRITDWEISEDLEGELYEGDANFDPYSETRPGLVFCYRNDRKMWCEELFIDLSAHRLEALRLADARFRNLKDEDREPPEGRAGQAIQESPTQMIGNYLKHNWRENVTEGYGRVLAMQQEKDIEADNVIYYEDTDCIHAWGDVVVHQYGGEWLVESGAIEEVEDERAREDVRKPTVITADAVLSYSERVSWGFGNVVFRQEEQIITGDRCQYEDETQMLVIAGDVDYENEDGERLSCALLTMDLYMEEYIAEGAAIARSIVPEEYRENLAEFRRDEDRQPEDDARTRLLENRTAAGLGEWEFAIGHPPPPPPIEVLPGAEGEVETPPQLEMELGPEVPPPAPRVGEAAGLSVGESEPAVEPPVGEAAGLSVGEEERAVVGTDEEEEADEEASGEEPQP